MRTVDLVRCVVTMPGDESAGSVRYVPLDLFDLWKFLMEERHGFKVGQERSARWVDTEAFEKGAGGQGNLRAYPVIEVRFRYHDRPGPAREVVRYFPAEEFEPIKKYVLGHFDDARREGEVVETTGFFIDADPA